MGIGPKVESVERVELGAAFALVLAFHSELVKLLALLLVWAVV
jgi:hypothetical protein